MNRPERITACHPSIVHAMASAGTSWFARWSKAASSSAVCSSRQRPLVRCTAMTLRRPRRYVDWSATCAQCQREIDVGLDDEATRDRTRLAARGCVNRHDVRGAVGSA